MTDVDSEAHKPSWWAPDGYEVWDPDDVWIKRRDDISRVVEKILNVTDKSDKSVSWLNLHGRLTWEQPHNEGEDYRWAWVDFMSCLVPRIGVTDFMSWVKKNGHTQESMASPPQVLCDIPNYVTGNEQIDGKPGMFSKCSVKDVRVTTFEHKMEKLLVPHFELINGLQLRWMGRDTQWVDAESKRAAFDPIVNEEGPISLLFREDLMRRYLEDEVLTMYWVIRCEKSIVNKSTDVNQLRTWGMYILGTKGSQGKLTYIDV